MWYSVSEYVRVLGRPIASIICNENHFNLPSLTVVPCSETVANITATALNNTVSKKLNSKIFVTE